jgi:hypothetical protein
MRSVGELMGIFEKEIDVEASTTAISRVGIGVSSKDGGTVVWHDPANCQDVLDTLPKNGGEVIGLIRITDNAPSGGGITINPALFEEYREDLAAKTALNKISLDLGDDIRKQLAQCGHTRVISVV